MTDANRLEQNQTAPHPPRLWRSLPVRTAIITVKLLLVYVMSLRDAAFFYQQF